MFRRRADDISRISMPRRTIADVLESKGTDRLMSQSLGALSSCYNGRDARVSNPVRKSRLARAGRRASLAALPSSLGSYRVQHQLGVGTLGPVFLAADEVLHVTAAVKVFDVGATPEQIVGLVQRLNAVAARLSSHPGIIKLFEAGVANHVAYLATEHAEGMPLDARLRERDATLPAEALGWLEAMAEAIDSIHADGVDHGSLHPRDILLTTTGPRVTGCGIARSVEDVDMRAPVRLPYTAPERAAGPSWGRAADIFSLAVIAFECLAGTRPTGTGRTAADRLPPTVSPEHDRALREVFARGLSADAERRPASAGEFVRALLDAGAPYVYGSDAKRGAVHHRAGKVRRPAAKASAPEGVAEGPTENVELARFARDGVLPASPPPTRGRRRPTASTKRTRVPTPTDASDPLTLFQPESDESSSNADSEAELEPVTDAESIADREPVADAGETLHPLAAAATSGLTQVPAAPPANGQPATDGQPDEDAAGEPEDEAAIETAASADTRGEPDGWLASTVAVPLVDVPDEIEHRAPTPDVVLPPRPELVEERGGGLVGNPEGMDGDRTLDTDRVLVDFPDDFFERREGPNELGGTPWDDATASFIPSAVGPFENLWVAPEAREGSREAAAPLGTLAEAGPGAREVDLSLDERVAQGAPVGGSTLFAHTVLEWDEPPDAPRRRRFVMPLLLLLLAAGVGAWYYGGWAPPQLHQEVTEPPARSAGGDQATPPAGEATPAGSSEPTRLAGATAAPRERPTETGPSAAAAPRPREATPVGAAATEQRAAARGRLLVRTSPSAAVTVDGVPRGTSPVAVYALDWGPHTVVVSRPGYAEDTRRVMIAPDRPAPALTIDLRRDDATPAAAPAESSTVPPPAAPAHAGAIVMVTRPAGARVLVDGQSAGTTPATIPSVPAGPHNVRFELTGYRGWETSVTVEAGQRLRVAASLERDR
ncbi:MAG: PEGA domain-containing protein [Luteitalea sp.]|nr:PEGA domain-containing protein [Luteitalea sp.]